MGWNNFRRGGFFLGTLPSMEWIFWIVFIVIPIAMVLWFLSIAWSPKQKANHAKLVAEREAHARAQMKRDQETLG